ncbi:hypothetical protein [Lewinella sp. 4G2]|uniref:hypothetical protein n=1 Tax=Lewinella sp. 4G2 TaxID=1803372 RepID=UPI0007B467BD|nr:hypothetical protein [Lewinella sp. 4G2]OAV43645.1 hypothetical protein A3850_003650 [Lewinella sp. 4G2]
MGCNSGNVQNVVKNTSSASEAIQKLEEVIAAQDAGYRATFETAITERLKQAQLDDPREIGYERHIKTEYVSEFSLDAIANVITSILKSTLATYTAGPNPALSAAAIDSYVDVVASVAEAAKSSSSSSGDFSFSMTRIAPGLLVFLYAVSESLSDSGVFGTEAISTTAIYYKLIESKQDVVKSADFQALTVAAVTYVTMQGVLLKLAERLAEDPFLVDDPDALFDKYERMVKKARLSMEALSGQEQNGPLMMGAKPATPKTTLPTQPVKDALQVLAGRGDRFAKIIAGTRARLAEMGE